MKGNKDIESIYRKAFEGYTPQPSPTLWQHLARKLAIREFLHFSWSSLNIYSVSVLVTAGVAAWLILHSPQREESGINEEVTGSVKQTPVKTNTGKETGIVVNPVGVTPPKSTGDHARPSGVGGTENNTEENTNVQEDAKANDNTGPVEPERKVNGKTKTHEQTEEKRTSVTSQPAPVPEVDFVMEPRAGCPPLTVHFRNRSTYFTTQTWHFGDEATSTLPDPEYIFDEPGTHIVKLTVMGTDDSLHTVTDTVTVFRKPEARFEVMVPQETDDDVPVSFYNYSVDAVSSLWDFGDHTTSTLHDPVHHYTGEGPFDVILRVRSAKGCVDSMVVLHAFEKNPYYIRFPDAFVPDPNGPSGGYYTEGMNVNAVFHPVYFGVMDYQLRVFNRFGELIFESKDINRGWDGYINGSMAGAGVYVWKVHGTFSNGKPFMQYGNVTLVKR